MPSPSSRPWSPTASAWSSRAGTRSSGHFRCPSWVPALPAELADRARSLQTQITTLTARVVDAMAATMAEIELAATERADRPERAGRPVPRQWQPAYVDARA